MNNTGGLFGVWSFLHAKPDDAEVAKIEKRMSAKTSEGIHTVFLTAVSLLVILDLAGDATELLTALFVAHFDPLFVFTAAVIALIGATAVETTIGNRLGRFLSAVRLRFFSLLVFLVIGSTAILTVLLHY